MATDELQVHMLVGDEESSCPHCGQRMKLGLAGHQAPAAGRVALCGRCAQFLILTEELRFRLPTGPERVSIEANGLAASLREDRERLVEWQRTGKLRPKRCPSPQPEPLYIQG